MATRSADDGKCTHGGPAVDQVPPTLAHLLLHFAAAGNPKSTEDKESKNTLPECLDIVKEHPEVACPLAARLLLQFAIDSFLQVRLRLAKSQYSKAKFVELCMKHSPANVVAALESKQQPPSPILMELLQVLQKSSVDEGLLAALKAEAPCACLNSLQIKVAEDNGEVSNQEFLKKALPEAVAAGSAPCSNRSCAKQLPGAQLKRCARCKVAAYCSKECQLAHWKTGHKAECKQMAT